MVASMSSRRSCRACAAPCSLISRSTARASSTGSASHKAAGTERTISASGPEAAYREIEPYLAAIAGRGVSYVGEGELARICKIAHNVMLGVVIQNLAEITILTQKAGVPRQTRSGIVLSAAR